MELLHKHIWVVLLLVSTINLLVSKSRTKKYIVKDPSLKKGYSNFYKAWVFFVNIPILIICIGSLTGMVNDFFDFLQPSTEPIVLLFHSSILVLGLSISFWVFFQNGAAFLEKHPGLLLQSGYISAKNAKILAFISLLNILILIILIWN